MRNGTVRAFTLIELLIVVAIIAVLSAIALPNFLEAQTRTKVSRAMADMRSCATAIESYCVDYSTYPLDGAVLTNYSVIYPTGNPSDAQNRTKFAGPGLTTPVAYMTSHPKDPFNTTPQQEEMQWYFYSNLTQASKWLSTNMGTVPPMIQIRMNDWGNWMMMGSGPDRDRLDVGSSSGQFIVNGYYDATNGTISNGDIVISQRRSFIGR